MPLIALLLASLLALPAVAQDKPRVVFSRPDTCPDEKTSKDACRDHAAAFAAVSSHTTMQRRLANVTFETRTAPATEAPFVAVHDPAGREAIRWIGWPRPMKFADILALVNVAAPHLLASHRAETPAVAQREWALATLALGEENRGRELLEEMLRSDSAENRELAAVWLERLKTRQRATPDAELVSRLAREGSTPRVRFEAWMAAGDFLLDQGHNDEAIAAFDRAAELELDAPFARHNARAARDRAIALSPALLGLGTPELPVAGRRMLQPRVVGKGVATVEYRLNGKLVATAKRAPFAAAVSFARVPARQVLEVTIRDAARKVVRRESVVVNERSEAFAVTIVEPSKHELSGAVDVVIEARIPRGGLVDQLVVEWNGRRVARFTAPPYRTRIHVAPGEQGTLRAVLRLDDGSEVEDVLLANTGTMLFEAQAHLVEVPVYFDAERAAANEVVVTEDGKPRNVERLIRPEEAPLLIALLIDASNSMTEHMLDVQEAALRFVEENIEPRDRTMVVAFDSAPRVMLRATSDRERVERAILALRPRGGTALYDAMITTLMQLQSSGSRRALVVFSDGLDASSVFSSGDAVEIARRAGVPLYVLAFTPELPPGPPRQRPNAGLPTFGERISLMRKELTSISRRTGAKAWELRSLERLPELFREIGEDLRKQSLLIYRTVDAGAEWRALEVKVNGREVRAPSGVFVTSEER